MRFQFKESDDDENSVIELDNEAIDYFIEGLQDLHDLDVGEEMTTPILVSDSDTSEPEGVSQFILRKVEDSPLPEE